MFYIRFLSLGFLLFFNKAALAQNGFTVLNESNLALNHKASTSYKLNLSFKSRNYLFEKDAVIYRQRHLEIGHFSTFSVSLKSSVSLGVLYRNIDWFENFENEFRTTLQYNIKSIKDQFRFGHRIRAEQRFFENQTIYRFRYRLAFDIPLNGEKLNIGETYFVSTTEFLWSITKLEKPLFDNRWSAQIGWLLSNKTKLQLGLEYRFDRFNEGSQQSLFLLTSAIFNI